MRSTRSKFAWLVLLLAAAAVPPGAAAGAPEQNRNGCDAYPGGRAALRALAAGGFEVADAAERQRLALAMAGCLGDPEPAIRDDAALTGLATWLRGGRIDEATRLTLAEQLLDQVQAGEDADGFRRPFAALALAEVARADRLAPSLPEAVRTRIVAAAAGFLETTRDFRGYDAEGGWRHAVAHGADLVLQIGMHPATTADEMRRLLAALATAIAPPGVSWIHGEPERLARAVFFLHGRGLLDDAFWDGWFAAAGAPAPLAGWGEAFRTTGGLARRHDVLAFLHAVAFAARANPGPASDRLGALAHRELVRVQGG